MRLELGLSARKTLALRFQFHKGAIRTSAARVASGGAAAFQFHKGAIRTAQMMPSDFSYVFQFHKGAIRTFFLW